MNWVMDCFLQCGLNRQMELPMAGGMKGDGKTRDPHFTSFITVSSAIPLEPLEASMSFF
jgi:hypothetical protein